MRILSRLTLAAAILAGGALLIPAVANAGDNQPVSPMSVGELIVACGLAGGNFGASGHIYWCTHDDCDGEGGTCSIGCSDEAGIETCEGSTPGRVSTGHKFQRQFLRSLGTRFLPASQGDTGTPNHTAEAATPAAPAANTTVIY